MAQHRRRADAHGVVLFFDVHTRRLREALHAGRRVAGRTAAGAFARPFPFAFAFVIRVTSAVGGVDDHVAARSDADADAAAQNVDLYRARP